MTAPAQPITTDQRQQLEELYRQQVSAVRTLARLLGYPCPIASRAERRNPVEQAIDERIDNNAILGGERAGIS